MDNSINSAAENTRPQVILFSVDKLMRKVGLFAEAIAWPQFHVDVTHLPPYI